MIRLDNVSVVYSHRRILDGCSLVVRPRECIGLLGPSGSGKSTILRLLTGEQRPQTGAVSIGTWSPLAGRRTERPPAGLLGVIHQDPVDSLDSLWTVSRCVEEPLIAAGKRGRATMVREMLAHVRLGHIDPNSPVRALSVGQAQRVAMARALVARPAAILGDEPTSALDPTTAATIVALLREAANTGSAVLIVSHNEPLLYSFCDHVVRLESGRILNGMA